MRLTLKLFSGHKREKMTARAFFSFLMAGCFSFAPAASHADTDAEAFRLVAPRDGEITWDATPTLEWEACSDSTVIYYEVWLNGNKAGTVFSDEQKYPASWDPELEAYELPAPGTYTYPGLAAFRLPSGTMSYRIWPALTEGSYSWRVVAVNAGGEKSSSAGTYSFIVDEDCILKQLEHSVIVSIQDHDKIDELDHHGVAEFNHPLEDYDRKWASCLKDKLGMTLKIVRSDEMWEIIDALDPPVIEDVATKWSQEAEAILSGTYEDLKRNARLYLSMQELTNRYKADGITYSDWYMNGFASDNPNPTGIAMTPLSNMELSLDNIVACSQVHVNNLSAAVAGQHLSGQRLLGYVGDYMMQKGTDPPRVYNHAHCSAPTNMHIGYEKDPTYKIENHITRQGYAWGEIFTNIPDAKPITTIMDPRRSGEIVTLVDWDPYYEQMLLLTGVALDIHKIGGDYYTLCRNKIPVRLDNPEGLRILPVNTPTCKGVPTDWCLGNLGSHGTLFYGDMREAFEHLARRLDFEIIQPSGAIFNPSRFGLISPGKNAVIRNKEDHWLKWASSFVLHYAVDHYDVWIDHKKIGSTTAANFKIPRLSKGEHEWYVVAVDRYGNERRSSGIFSFTVQ